MNIPGIFSIKYFETKKYELPILRENATINISEFVEDPLINLPFIPETAYMGTKQKETDHGTLEVLTINFKIAGHDASTIQQLKSIKKSFHSFVITDKTKLKYLLGNINEAIPTLSYDLKNDATGTGGKSINAVISLQTSIFPVYITE